MSKIKVDSIEVYSSTNGINFPNGVKVGTTEIRNSEIVAQEFVGIPQPGLPYAYPATNNSMTSKRYVDDAINALLPGAGLSGVSKQYVDNGLSANYANSISYSIANFMRKNTATEHTIGGITFSGQGPYVVTSTGNPSLEISSSAPVLRLTETDTTNSVGTLHLDSGIFKLAYGSSVSNNNNSIAINASGHAGIGDLPVGNIGLTINNRIANGAGPALKVMGSGDVVINTGGSIFFDNFYSYASGSYIDARTAGVQKFKNGLADRMVISTTSVNIPMATSSSATGNGALTILGGVGIGENLNVGGVISGAGTIPLGGIIVWSGSIASIPSGWALCNGQTVNGLATPDLRDRFIVGASGDNGTTPNTNITGSLTQIGGNKDTTLPAHTHAVTVTDPGHRHYFIYDDNWGSGGYGIGRPGNNLGGGCQGSGTTVLYETDIRTTGITVAISASGSSSTNANLPPYFALAFIMRVR